MYLCHTSITVSQTEATVSLHVQNSLCYLQMNQITIFDYVKVQGTVINTIQKPACSQNPSATCITDKINFNSIHTQNTEHD